jgi:hypothetical protein
MTVLIPRKFLAAPSYPQSGVDLCRLRLAEGVYKREPAVPRELVQRLVRVLEDHLVEIPGDQVAKFTSDLGLGSR